LAERWIDALAGFEPSHESERLAWAFCLAQLARRSGQRAIDVDDSHRRTVLTILGGDRLPRHWAQMVEEVTDLDADDQPHLWADANSELFGEALPIGLRLVRPAE